MRIPATGCHRPLQRRRRFGVCGALFLLLAPSAPAFEVDVRYTGEFLANMGGGIGRGVRYLDNLDLEFTHDLGPGSLYVHGLYNNGTGFSADLVGDLQAVSNIEAVRAWRIYEAWYEFGAEAWSLKTGLYDLNSEFDVNTVGSLFIHSSHGIGADVGQTGRNGPGIFPVSALAIRGAVTVGPGTARMALLDGVPGHPTDPASNRISLDGDDGILAVVEYDRPVAATHRVWAGYWRYSSASAYLADPPRRSRDEGWYLGIESTVTVAGHDVGWFLRYGEAREALNVFGGYAGAGIVIDAPFPGRPEDQLGLAVASAAAGSPYRRVLETGGTATRSRETAWELTYRAAVGERLSVQPDLQYVVNPAALATPGHALVVGLRFELTY